MIESIKGNEVVDALLQGKEVSEYINNLKEHHEDTAEHSIRVGVLAADLAHENGLPDEDIELLGLAGLLHDLGKHDIAGGILSKPSDLDHIERATIQEHPRRTFIKLGHPSFEAVRKIVVGHHEYKVGPYPRNNGDRRSTERNTGDRRNSDKKIGTLTEMLAAVDMFDALASRRAYKEPFSREEIAKTMREEFTGNQMYVEQLLK